MPSFVGCVLFRGHAAYGSAVKLRKDSNETELEVGASYFMTYHTVLKTSQNFTDALRFAREIGDNLTKALIQNTQRGESNDTAFFNVTQKVFPYRSV